MASDEKISAWYPEEKISSRNQGSSLAQVLEELWPGLGKWLNRTRLGTVLGEGMEEPDPKEAAMAFGPGVLATITPAQIRGGLKKYVKETPSMTAKNKRLWEAIQKWPKAIRRDPDFVYRNTPFKELNELYTLGEQRMGNIKPGEQAIEIAGLREGKGSPVNTVSITRKGRKTPVDVAHIPKDVGNFTPLDPVFLADHEILHQAQSKMMRELRQTAPEKAREYTRKYNVMSEAEADLYPMEKWGQGTYGKANLGLDIAAAKRLMTKEGPTQVEHYNTVKDYLSRLERQDVETAKIKQGIWNNYRARQTQQQQQRIANEVQQMNAYLGNEAPAPFKAGKFSQSELVNRKRTTAEKIGKEAEAAKQPNYERVSDTVIRRKPPVEKAAPKATASTLPEGVSFNGVQEIPGKPDQYVYTDAKTKSTFYSASQDPTELAFHRDRMRASFAAADKKRADALSTIYPTREAAETARQNVGFMANAQASPEQLVTKRLGAGKYKVEYTPKLQKGRLITSEELDAIRARMRSKQDTQAKSVPISAKEIELAFIAAAKQKGYTKKVVGDYAYLNKQGKQIKLISGKDGITVFEEGIGRYKLPHE